MGSSRGSLSRSNTSTFISTTSRTGMPWRSSWTYFAISSTESDRTSVWIFRRRWMSISRLRNPTYFRQKVSKKVDSGHSSRQSAKPGSAGKLPSGTPKEGRLRTEPFLLRPDRSHEHMVASGYDRKSMFNPLTDPSLCGSPQEDGNPALDPLRRRVLADPQKSPPLTARAREREVPMSG